MRRFFSLSVVSVWKPQYNDYISLNNPGFCAVCAGHVEKLQDVPIRDQIAASAFYILISRQIFPKSIN